MNLRVRWPHPATLGSQQKAPHAAAVVQRMHHPSAPPAGQTSTTGPGGRAIDAAEFIRKHVLTVPDWQCTYEGLYDILPKAIAFAKTRFSDRRSYEREEIPASTVFIYGESELDRFKTKVEVNGELTNIPYEFALTVLDGTNLRLLFTGTFNVGAKEGSGRTVNHLFSRSVTWMRRAPIKFLGEELASKYEFDGRAFYGAPKPQIHTRF